MNENYKQTLVEAINFLNETQTELFTKAINIEMAGDLNSINETFKVGDTFEFEMAHLETSEDHNIQKIVELINSIDAVTQTIMNLNNISDEDLNNEDD